MTEKRLRLWQAQAFEEWKRSRFDAITGYDDEQKWNVSTGEFDTTKTARYKEVQGGTIEVVTGGGKTAVGFMAICDWLRKGDNQQVVVCVPTTRLLHQWSEELSEMGATVCRWGGGHGRPNTVDSKIVVGVVNSLRKWEEPRVNVNRLLIVDECHRLGSDGNSIIPQVIPHDAILGLSATPERSDGKSVTALTGPIIYRLSYREALDAGIIPSFTLKAVAAPLSWVERFEYDDYSQKIAIVNGKISEEFGSGGNFFAIPENASPNIAIYKALCNNRKRLVNNSRGRIDLLTHLLAKHAQDKVILFHESVSALNGLAHRFKDAYDPAVYHYEIENREEEFQRWMDGDTKLLFSCRALNEGMNAPEVDVAIMLSGSNGVRSRIQTLGRALRGENALIYLVYAPQTTDTKGLTGLISSGGVPKKFVKHFAWQDDTLTGITAPYWFSNIHSKPSHSRNDTPVEHRLFGRAPLPLLDEAIGYMPVTTFPYSTIIIPPYLGGGDTQ